MAAVMVVVVFWGLLPQLGLYIKRLVILLFSATIILMSLSKVTKHLLLKLMLLQLISLQTWYLDTGATNHITSNFGNLTLGAKEYHGSNQMHVGNGQGLHIHHIGSSYISFPSIHFVLHNILHVLRIH